jgi:hypothetical protein
MKTIKVYVEGGVCTDVTGLPPGYNYEVIDYDHIDAEKEAAQVREKGQDEKEK